MSDRLSAKSHRLGTWLGTWLTAHRVIRYLLTTIATVAACVLIVVVIGAVGEGITAWVKDARARQTWALVAVGAGDPVQLSQWPSWEFCEARRQEMARTWYERRGVAPALRCEGVHSWAELLGFKNGR